MALRQLESTLAGLVGQVVTSDPKINKLTDIGISTTKDGLLTVDNAKLQKALETDAGAVEALFNPRRDATHDTTTDPGIAFALDAIRDTAVATDGLLARIETSLDTTSETPAAHPAHTKARKEAPKT